MATKKKATKPKARKPTAKKGHAPRRTAKKTKLARKPAASDVVLPPSSIPVRSRGQLARDELPRRGFKDLGEARKALAALRRRLAAHAAAAALNVSFDQPVGDTAAALRAEIVDLAALIEQAKGR